MYSAEFTVLKRSEWGLFTGASFLLAIAFPPYFLELIGITFLGGIGLLWRSLGAGEKILLSKFEKKFRQGYRKQQDGKTSEALAIYKKLIQEFKESPMITRIAKKQIETIIKGQKKKSPPRKSSPKSKKSKALRSRRAKREQP